MFPRAFHRVDRTYMEIVVEAEKRRLVPYIVVEDLPATLETWIRREIDEHSSKVNNFVEQKELAAP